MKADSDDDNDDADDDDDYGDDDAWENDEGRNGGGSGRPHKSELSRDWISQNFLYENKKPDR